MSFQPLGLLGALLAVCSCSTPTMAADASISGQVTDPQGASVPMPKSGCFGVLTILAGKQRPIGAADTRFRPLTAVSTS
ncbi:MAG TPA: hypothetical protein VKX49_16250 [Bryobacteraceae bacterium]|nr:hypothetical protein [Bryobacteraceae bacterium]